MEAEARRRSPVVDRPPSRRRRVTELIRLRPYINKAMTYVSGRTTLDALAASVEELEEPETEWTPPALFLDGELEKVRAAQGETSLEAEFARVRGRLATHKPLKRYELHDVLVYPSGLSLPGGTFVRYGPLPHRALLTGPVERLSDAVFCADQPTMAYFGHWLMEACCTALLRREGEALILPTPGAWPHTRDYVRIFDFDPAPGEIFHVERLSWYVDFMQGRSHQARYRELRRRVTAKFPNAPGGGRFFLKRGSGGARRNLANEEAVIARLERAGFEALDLERETLDAIMQKAVGAAMIVTIEGSNQAHATMMLRDGGLLLTIQPADRFNNVYRERTHAMGLDYGFAVAEREAESGDHHMDPEILMRTIDLADAPRKLKAPPVE